MRARLLRWYDSRRRALPWRVERGMPAPDAYRIWLSEVMLQQTRVETVERYYARWLERFPTLTSLAAAPLDDVLKAWEGLGYYARARNFHRAVREVGDRYGGEIPRDPATFLSLPGVGRYTAGAVMSIAFGLEEPVVDGNVRRVFARLLDDPEPSPAELWALAEALVHGDRPGDLNQALMELGATVCTPRAPDCSVCPIPDHCAAFAAGRQRERPGRPNKRRIPREHQGVAVILREERILLARVPPDRRLGGLWEIPGTARRPGERSAAAAARAAAERLALPVRPGIGIGTVDHTFTHVKVSYHAFLCTIIAGEPTPADYDALVWAAADDLPQLALPVAQRKLLTLVLPRLPSAEPSPRFQS